MKSEITRLFPSGIVALEFAWDVIALSALNGTNIDKLLAEISKKSADILGLKKYRLFISPETHPEQMRWLAELEYPYWWGELINSLHRQANVWSMIDPEYNYEDISERFPHGYISFDAYLDEVTYRRYMAKFEKQNENPEEKGFSSQFPLSKSLN